MVRTVRKLTLVLAALSLVWLGAGRATAQAVVLPAPSVSYYYPAPVVSYTYGYYSPPAVSYYSAPVVYAPAPAVSYYYGAPVVYSAPAVSYYYTSPAAVTTTRYGLFGRPRVSTTYYGWR